MATGIQAKKDKSEVKPPTTEVVAVVAALGLGITLSREDLVNKVRKDNVFSRHEKEESLWLTEDGNAFLYRDRSACITYCNSQTPPLKYYEVKREECESLEKVPKPEVKADGKKGKTKELEPSPNAGIPSEEEVTDVPSA